MDDSNTTIIDSSSQTYNYSPLDPSKKSIRLLTILPASHHSSPIHCNIEAADITWRSSFDALSYTWGPPGDDSPNPILLNGHPAIISRNLDAALRALRGVAEPLVLWVDALCINQRDNDEKSTQVAMMDAIYEKAKRTLVWLGDESEDSNVAMTKLAGMQSKKDLDNITDVENAAIGRLFSRPWFSRVWVVQEFSLARSVVFHCGRMSFPWAPIEKTLRKLMHGHGLLDSNTRESKKPATEMLDKLCQSQIWLRLLMDRQGVLKEGYGNYTVEKSFRGLVETHIHLEATCPHDRIYGLLALGRKRGADLSKCPPIDYADSVTSVNIAWAKWMIEESGKLDILFACQKTIPEPGLPSWVPNWRVRDDETFIPNFSSGRLMFYASSKFLIIANNHKQVKIRSAKFSFSADNRLLTLEGKQLAVLDKTYQFKDIEPEYYRKFVEFLPAGYISGEPQTLWQDFKEYQERNSAIKVPMMAAWQIPKDYAAAREKTPARLEKLRGIVEKNRKQFVSKGGCEGLVPKETKTGDVLCLFKSMETPFVVRPVGERYQIIGECFVDGYMKGRRVMGESKTFMVC